MNSVQRFLQSAALVLLASVSALLVAAEPQSEHPANPAAKTLQLPNDPRPLGTYIDPTLRAVGPDAIERSDFMQAKGGSSVDATARPPAPPHEPSGEGKSPQAQEPSLPSAPGGHAGHRSGRTDRPKN